MRNAYALLGFTTLLVIVGAVYAFNRGSAENANEPITSSSDGSMASTLALASAAFQNGESIPSPYTCDAENVSPPLRISGIPEGSKSLALVMDDPDVPKALRPDGVFDHWTLFNIPPDTREIAQAGSAGTPGANGAGKNAYTGPCPPKEYEPSEHRYFFRLYALDAELPLPEGAAKADVLNAMEGHVLGQAELVGRYKRR